MYSHTTSHGHIFSSYYLDYCVAPFFSCSHFIQLLLRSLTLLPSASSCYSVTVSSSFIFLMLLLLSPFLPPFTLYLSFLSYSPPSPLALTLYLAFLPYSPRLMFASLVYFFFFLVHFSRCYYCCRCSLLFFCPVSLSHYPFPSPFFIVNKTVYA